jgi:hypothetical protein
MDTKFNHLHNNFWVFAAHERNLNVTDGIVNNRNLDFLSLCLVLFFGLGRKTELESLTIAVSKMVFEHFIVERARWLWSSIALGAE